MIQVQVFARDPVHVRERHLLDPHQIIVGRLQSVERNRVRPDRSQSCDRGLLELGGAALLGLGGLDQISRHTLMGHLGEDGAHRALDRLRIVASGKRHGRIGKARLRQRVEGKLRVDRLALGNQPVEVEAAAAQHIGKHLERRKVGAVEARRTHRDHLRPARTVGIDAERRRPHGA